MLSFQELKDIKIRYISLRKQSEQLSQQKQLLLIQNQKLKQKLTEVTNQHTETVKNFLFEKRKETEDQKAQQNQYEEILKDKEDQIRKYINVFQAKEKQHQNQIHNLNNVIEELRNNIQEVRRLSEGQIHNLLNQISKKQNSSQKTKTSMENMKEENSMLRKQLREMDQTFSLKEQEWMQTQDELIFQINNLRRRQTDVQYQIQQAKSQNLKLEFDNKQSKEKIEVMNVSIKSLEQKSAEVLDNLTHSYELKIEQYLHQITELKQSVEELLQVKSIYNKENEILKEKVNKQQQLRKKRRMMMRSQLREIQMLQNSIKKVV